MVESMTMTEMPTADDPDAFAVALVQAAVDLHKTEGNEATAAHYNDPATIDGQWYVFITDENDIFVAHPATPALVGKDLKDVMGIDGSMLGVDIAKATDAGRWIEYLWPNPENNKLEQKRTWTIRHDGYLFAAGYYVSWAPNPATLTLASKDDPVAYTHDLVLQAIAGYEFAGIEATAAHYNDPASIDGQWYVFITGENDSFVAHAPMPALLGTDLKDVVGSDGYMLGIEIAKATEIGLWVEYLWPNPVTGEDARKRTWAIRHDGYLFGTGYYEPAEVTEPVMGDAAPDADDAMEAADTTPEAN